MQKIEFEVTGGKIILPAGAPFDGEPVLIKLAEGWCEARWEHQIITQTQDGPDYDGFFWICLDDKFQAELEEATHWAFLPTGEK